MKTMITLGALLTMTTLALAGCQGSGVMEPLARRIRRSIPQGDTGRPGSGPALGPSR